MDLLVDLESACGVVLDLVGGLEDSVLMLLMLMCVRNIISKIRDEKIQESEESERGESVE